MMTSRIEGYQEWLSSSEDINTDTIHNMTQMTDAFNKKKKNMRELIVHQGIQDLGNDAGYNLTRDTPSNYSSNIFSKLQFEDVKKAHTETVVPVTHEDFLNKKQFKSTHELNTYRSQNESLLTNQESELKYKQQKHKEHTTNVERAYKLAKQCEDMKKTNDSWWGNLRCITNK